METAASLPLSSAVPPVGSWPPTFAGRGVATPFTSPCLSGTYVSCRAGAGVDSGVVTGGELIVIGCDAAGVPRVCRWDDVVERGRITLHDRMLMQCLGSAGAVTPRLVKAAARTVARVGLAGRVAQRAALAADVKEEEDRLITEFLLVVRLLSALGVRSDDWTHLGPVDPAFQSWLVASIERLVPVLGDTAPQGPAVQAWVEEASALMAPVGLPNGEFVAAQEIAREKLDEFADDVAEFGAGETGALGEDARAMAAAAQRVSALVGAAITDCHRLIADLPALYAGWRVQGPAVIGAFEQVDWLLDGWLPVCCLWKETAVNGRDARRAAVSELNRQIPLLPADLGTGGGSRAAPLSWDGRRTAADGCDFPVTAPPGLGELERVYRREILKAHTI